MSLRVANEGAGCGVSLVVRFSPLMQSVFRFSAHGPSISFLIRLLRFFGRQVVCVWGGCGERCDQIEETMELRCYMTLAGCCVCGSSLRLV